MKIVVSGATGFVGRALLSELGTDWHPVVLTRNAARAQAELGSLGIHTPKDLDAERSHARRGSAESDSAGSRGMEFVEWNPQAEGALEDALVEALDGADAVVHLAGATAVGRRLTAARRKSILQSRVRGTAAITRAMAQTTRRPAVLVCASAIGYYGAHPGNEVVDEATPPGSDFLANVCVEWERAALEAQHSATRVVLCRLGVVLGRGGGALKAMARPIRAFAGGRLGSGQQVVSWVHVRDVARALRFVVEHAELDGALNITAPGACTNAELIRAIAHALHRPTWLPAPEFALRLALGEGASALTTGQRVSSRRLEQAGFSFLHPELAGALREAL